MPGLAPRPLTTEAAIQPPSRTLRSYKATVKGDNPYILTVHVGTDERSYVEKELFFRLIDEVEKVILADQSKEVPELYCFFRRWAGGWGLLGCPNKATADYLSWIVTGIKMVFKGCSKGGAR